jgi:hypothetical protein
VPANADEETLSAQEAGELVGGGARHGQKRTARRTPRTGLFSYTPRCREAGWVWIGVGSVDGDAPLARYQKRRLRFTAGRRVVKLRETNGPPGRAERAVRWSPVGIAS